MRVLYLAALTCSTFAVSAQTVQLKNVRLIDGTGRPAVEHADITIRGEKIASVATGASKAAPESTVIPGLINAHGHLALVKDTKVSSANYTGVNVMRELMQYERYGVTTMMSLGLNKDLVYKIRAEQGKGNEPGATLLTAGRGIGVPDGMPPMKLSPDQIYRPKTAEQARTAVREMASHSPNLIKIWVDDNLGKMPKMDPAIYTAVIDEAHRANLKVAAHIYYLEDAKKLVASGVDFLAHSVRDKPVDADFISQMKSRNVYYIPTLQLEESFYIFGEQPAWMNSSFFRDAVTTKELDLVKGESKAANLEAHKKAFQIAMDNVKRLHTATVPIGMGTDSGANAYRIPGWAEHRELELLVQAGLTPTEAIHSATEVNARMLGIEDRTGTIEKGRQADLIVVRGNPARSISDTEKIMTVFHKGRRVQRDLP